LLVLLPGLETGMEPPEELEPEELLAPEPFEFDEVEEPVEELLFELLGAELPEEEPFESVEGELDWGLTAAEEASEEPPPQAVRETSRVVAQSRARRGATNCSMFISGPSVDRTGQSERNLQTSGCRERARRFTDSASFRSDHEMRHHPGNPAVMGPVSR